MASAVSTVIDTRLVSVLARMARCILEDLAGQALHNRSSDKPLHLPNAPEQQHDQAR
jgi:hypothetical protein